MRKISSKVVLFAAVLAFCAAAYFYYMSYFYDDSKMTERPQENSGSEITPLPAGDTPYFESSPQNDAGTGASSQTGGDPLGAGAASHTNGGDPLGTASQTGAGGGAAAQPGGELQGAPNQANTGSGSALQTGAGGGAASQTGAEAGGISQSQKLYRSQTPEYLKSQLLKLLSPSLPDYTPRIIPWPASASASRYIKFRIRTGASLSTLLSALGQLAPREINHKFDELLARNKDVVGWISIDDTKVDYPVLYDGTHRYLEYNIDGVKTTAASIYMDPSNNINRDNHNFLVYGHNMKNGSMFGDIIKYKDESFFYNHRIIHFDTLYDDMVWEVFSVYVLDAEQELMYTRFGNDDNFFEIANGYRKRSLFPVDNIVLTSNDRMLTLSTCSYELSDARTIVHARLIYLNGEKFADK